MRKICSRLIISVLSIFMIALTIINPVSIRPSQSTLCKSSYAKVMPNFIEIIRNLFGRKSGENIDENSSKVYVYLGGEPLGFTINCSGVVVVAISNDSTKEIKEGDIITKIEGDLISSAEQISNKINSAEFAGKKIKLTINRNGTEFETYIEPIFDELTGKYRLGVWIRDNAAGVGTLTYIRNDNFRFGALGHPVCDIDTGTMMPLIDGNIFKCNIIGYKPGAKGAPGELKGLFLRSGSVLGELDKNSMFGVYGSYSKNRLDYINKELVEVASRHEVKCGKAKIRCTIDGTTPNDYDIEIVKTYFQNTKDNKSMFIRVTDKALIEKTGGIVQGMSGSPIIQNGKLVGAITHVFVSDPTKGYGVYAEWMIDN